MFLDVALTKVNVHFFIFLKNKIYLTAFHLKRLAAVLISFVRECTHLHADREDPVDVSGDRRKMTRTPPSVVRNGHTRWNQLCIPSECADEQGPDIKEEATGRQCGSISRRRPAFFICSIRSTRPTISFWESLINIWADGLWQRWLNAQFAVSRNSEIFIQSFFREHFNDFWCMKTAGIFGEFCSKCRGLFFPSDNGTKNRTLITVA